MHLKASMYNHHASHCGVISLHLMGSHQGKAHPATLPVVQEGSSPRTDVHVWVWVYERVLCGCLERSAINAPFSGHVQTTRNAMWS